MEGAAGDCGPYSDHNVHKAGSFLGFIVRALHVPPDAATGRGGDGGGAGSSASADDLANSGRLVAHRATRPPARGAATLARPAEGVFRRPQTPREDTSHKALMAALGDDQRAAALFSKVCFLARARYGMEGVPLVIDFVERGQRSQRRGARAA